jgi:hypothetical protein
MPPSLCLTRQYLGLTTRIECQIRPLEGENGHWALLFAAGMEAAQPSVVKAQGPFCGRLAAQNMLTAILDSLLSLDYVQSAEPLIWCLHLQAELRRLNQVELHHPGEDFSHPHR